MLKLRERERAKDREAELWGKYVSSVLESCSND